MDLYANMIWKKYLISKKFHLFRELISSTLRNDLATSWEHIVESTKKNADFIGYGRRTS